MSKRCTGKGFYLQGVKVRSGEAVLDTPSGPLTVVVGRPAVDGEINPKDVPAGSLLRLPGFGDVSLVFDPLTVHGGKGRREFDPSRVDPDRRDAYLAVAVSSMALGVRESADYARTVLDALLDDPGPSSTAALLERARRVLDPDFQQFDEVVGAGLLKHLAALAALGQDVPLDWVEGYLGLLTDWHALAVLAAPATFPAALEDALLSRVLHQVRVLDPEALPGFPDVVLNGSRSDAERTRLRAQLVGFCVSQVARRPGMVPDDLRDVALDAFERAALLETAPGEHPDAVSRRERATARLDALVRDAAPPPVRLPDPPTSVSRNVRRRNERVARSLAELSRDDADAAAELRARLAAAGLPAERISGLVASVDGRSEPDATLASIAPQEVRRLVGARRRLLDARESIWVRAEALALRDVSEPFPRRKFKAPRRPTLVEDAFEFLVDRRPTLLCEDLLGVVVDPSSIDPQSRATLLARYRDRVEECRTNLARAFATEARIARVRGWGDAELFEASSGSQEGSAPRPAEELFATRISRPSLFDDVHGPGVSLNSGFLPGSVTGLSALEEKLSRPEPVKGSEQARLEASSLFVRARLVHAALAPADDRFLRDVRAVVLSGSAKPAGARMSEGAVWSTVRNLENALYLSMALTAAWRGGFSDWNAGVSGFAANFEDEPSLVLSERDRAILKAVRTATLRLGADPLATSSACLSALRAATARWGDLQREQDAALASAQTRRDRRAVEEIRSSRPAFLPDALRRAVFELSGSRRPSNARRPSPRRPRRP